MQKRASFDFIFHHFTNARSNRDGAVMKDQATPERSLTLVATRIRCGILFVSILHSVLMRVISKVNTLTVRRRMGPRLSWRLGRRVRQTGFGARSWFLDSSFVLWNGPLSRGPILRVQCLIV